MTTTREAAEKAGIVGNLEWLWVDTRKYWQATTPLGRYIAWEAGGYAFASFNPEIGRPFQGGKSIDEAKAAAQADYEQRITLALNPDFLSELDTARAEIERLRERLRDIIDERDNLSTIIATEIDDVAGVELDDMEERATRAESALTAAQARIAELEKLVGDVHRVLCGTRDAPSHTVGPDIEWCIDHCRTARTLSPDVTEGGASDPL